MPRHTMIGNLTVNRICWSGFRRLTIWSPC